jgi:RNA polymerase sigma factor (sigma-70 family)
MAIDLTSEAYDAHHQALHGYLTAITRNIDVADDVGQEAYARLAQEVLEGRAPRDTRAWLFRVGRNLVISRGRRQQTAVKFQDRLRDEGVGPSAEAECLAREANRELSLLLARTSADDRTALLMAASGYSSAEIARALGISHAAVRTRLSRARGRLRTVMQPSVPC